ncbi:MAG: hypothetical protein ABL958_18380 [Bdellovibrionia bacterium]
MAGKIQQLFLALTILGAVQARAEFGDDDIELLDQTVKSGLQNKFGRTTYYAGPKGLLLLKNCDRVKLEGQSIGTYPDDPSGILNVPVTLHLTTGKKTDSIEAKVQIQAASKAQGGFVFRFEDVKVPEEQLSPKDHCAETRKNSRLFSSVQNREILRGMEEGAVRASWGAWQKKSSKDGATVLEYEGREVRLRGGLVESWSLQK